MGNQGPERGRVRLKAVELGESRAGVLIAELGSSLVLALGLSLSRYENLHSIHDIRSPAKAMHVGERSPTSGHTQAASDTGGDQKPSRDGRQRGQFSSITGCCSLCPL